MKILLKLFISLSVIYIKMSSSSLAEISREKAVSYDQDKVISLVGLKIIFDNKEQKQHDGFFESCIVRFKDSNGNILDFFRDEKYNYYLLNSEAGKVYIHDIKCKKSIIPFINNKSRYKQFDDYSFIAKRGFINYVGDITIKYDSGGFALKDLLSLGSLIEDNKGKYEIKVEDRIDDAISFSNNFFPELRKVKYTKSLLDDQINLKPNEVARIYSKNPYEKIEKIQINKEESFQDKKSKSETASQSSQNKLPIYQNNLKNSNSDFSYLAQPPKSMKVREMPNNNTPYHPYAAYQQNQYYNKYYNPYGAIGQHVDPFKLNTSEVQDPIVQIPRWQDTNYYYAEKEYY